MPNIMSMLQGDGEAPAVTGTNQADPQPQRMPQQNPLAALAAQAPQPRAVPRPTPGQTAAALHHFGEIKAALRPIIEDPQFGKTNVRPKLLDAASKLLANKVLSLPQIMNAIKGLPEDPMDQVKFVEKIYGDSDMAQKIVLMQHADYQADPGAAPEDEYSLKTHGAFMDGLAKTYNHRG